MDEEARGCYIEAGVVVQEAREKAREIAQPGTNLKEIADEIEEMIRKKDLKPAFPVNLSINDQAAHYTPSVGEERVLEKNDVLKIDIGAQKNGYIADTALTVNPSSEHREIIEAAEKVLESALEFVEPGVTVGELGTHVQNQVPEKYNVVRNLTGHYIDRYEQHAGISIPNVSNASNHVIEKGDAIAVEPFLTTGSGKVKEGAKGNIYKYEGGNVRGRNERKLLKEIKSFNDLPFTPRWFSSFSGRQKMALKRLVDAGVVHSYPILKELDGGIVAQAEHTVLVGVDNGENIVTTRS